MLKVKVDKGALGTKTNLIWRTLRLPVLSLAAHLVTLVCLLSLHDLWSWHFWMSLTVPGWLFFILFGASLGMAGVAIVSSSRRVHRLSRVLSASILVIVVVIVLVARGVLPLGR